MDHQSASSEITFEHHISDAEFKKRVTRTTIWLSIITIIELGIGLLIYSTPDASYLVHLTFKGVVCILTLAKAYYIVAVFMHLGDEIRNMIMTIVVPLLLFVWFIAAFIIDGHSYKNLRNTFDLHFKETTMPRKDREKAVETIQPAEQAQPGRQ